MSRAEHGRAMGDGESHRPRHRLYFLHSRDMDVNEKIVEEWVRRCKHQFTMVNTRFRTPRNYGDIDILAMDANGEVYDYEVKWRSTPWVGATPAETETALAGQLVRPERIKKIKELIGDRRYHRVFVTPNLMLGSDKKRGALLAELEKHDIEIKTFEDILADLVIKISPKGRYDSEVSQLIRMFKLFKVDVAGSKK